MVCGDKKSHRQVKTWLGCVCFQVVQVAYALSGIKRQAQHKEVHGWGDSGEFVSKTGVDSLCSAIHCVA
jgi:hypothetical protein